MTTERAIVQNTIPSVSWDDFVRSFSWKQGEHVAILAPTGAGKTHLQTELVKYRGYNIFFGTKIDDKEYRRLIRSGFHRVESVSEIKPWMDHVLLWPKFRKTIAEFEYRQRIAFHDALNYIVQQRTWTLWCDEAKYIAEKLGLKRELTFAFEQLRSIRGTIIAAAQRPAMIPISVLTNSTHFFMWRNNHYDDAKRLADIGGIDAKQIAQELKLLDDHEFLYIRSRGTQTHAIRSQVRK